MTARYLILATMILFSCLGTDAGALEPNPHEAVHTGEHAVKQATTPLAIRLAAYENLWQRWGLARH